MNLTLENARVVHRETVKAQPLSFEDGRVVHAPVGAMRVDMRGYLIVPGLINAHEHLQLNCVPPLAHAAPFRNSYAWISAMREHLQEPDVIAAVAVPSEERHWHGALKNLLAGVTTVAHHDPWHCVFDAPDFPVTVLRGHGWSHSLGLSDETTDGAPRYGPSVRDSFRATSPEGPWIIHLAEGVDEVASAELARLDAMGCLAPNTVIVHGVGLGAADVERIVAVGASVVWCPASNMELFGRTMTPRRLHEAGSLALGSDSRLTGSRDLLDELRVAAAHSELSPRELLVLVTTNASCVLRAPDRGGLAPGQHADCVIIRDADDPHAALLGTARSHIRAVVRAGLPAIANPDCADWFTACGVETVAVTLDGVPKLMARRFARPTAVELEPGLEFA